MACVACVQDGAPAHSGDEDTAQVSSLGPGTLSWAGHPPHASLHTSTTPCTPRGTDGFSLLAGHVVSGEAGGGHQVPATTVRQGQAGTALLPSAPPIPSLSSVTLRCREPSSTSPLALSSGQSPGSVLPELCTNAQSWGSLLLPGQWGERRPQT